MTVLFRSLGEHLIEEAKGATDEVLLVSPFIKQSALNRLLSPVGDGCSVRVVTRWDLQEIATGATDLEVWELLRGHEHHSLELSPSLHAKYYRFDDTCVAGSANLTGRALGFREQSNLELLFHVSLTETEEFEQELDDCVTVTESMYHRYRQLLEQYEEAHPDLNQPEEEYSLEAEEIEDEVHDSRETWSPQSPESEWWVPRLRHPKDLYRVYAGSSEEVTSAAWKHGQHDLRHFDLEEGLDETTFELEMRWQVLQKRVVQEIDELVETSKRFGAVRDHLRTLPCAEEENFDATRTWQTLMRWLLYFLGDRYQRREPSYSEIFVRTE